MKGNPADPLARNAALDNPTSAPVPQRSDWIALRILQVGLIAVVLAACTYKAFELDRFFVPKELVLHLTAVLAGLFALKTFRRDVFTRIDILLLAYLVLGAVSAAFATNNWLGVRALAVSASGIAIFWIARALGAAGLTRPLLAALAFAVVAGTLTSLLQTYGVRSDLFSINRIPGGTLGNRNFIAHLAAFGLPVVLLFALRASRTSRYLGGAVASTLVVAVLVLTRSRAGWLAFAAVILVFLLAMLIAAPMRRDARTWRRLAGLVAFAAAGVFAATFAPNALRWNSENPYIESIKGVANYQAGSGAGRVVQYEQSLNIAAAHPLLGVGPGNWAVEYPRYAKRRDPSMNRNEAGTTSNPWPSSDWVAFASERGLPAVMMLALAFIGIGLQGLRRLWRAPDCAEAVTATAMIATLVAATIAGAFDAVLLLPLPAMLVWAALGAMWSSEGSRPAEVSENFAKRAMQIAVLLAGIGAVRSAAQLTAMGIYANRDDISSLITASRFDPSNYDIQVRLARRSQSRKTRCAHGLAAHALYPKAETARQLSAGCR